MNALPLVPEPQSPWPEPQPLRPAVEAKPFPLDALPPIIGEAVEEVRRITKAPAALVASSALSWSAAACQGLANVERRPNLRGPLSLYFLSLAESGERKTTVDRMFRRPFDDFERDAKANGEPEFRRYRAEVGSWEAKRDGLRAKIKKAAGGSTAELERQLEALEQQEPQRPRLPRIIFADVTREKLGRTLAEDWPFGAVMSDEGGVFLSSHSLRKDVALGTLAFLNSLWDGSRQNVDRATTSSFVVDGARLSVGLAVQPVTWATFMGAGGVSARGVGFLSRFLMCEPPTTQGTRFEYAGDATSIGDTPARDRLFAVWRRCLDRAASNVLPSGPQELPTLKLSPEASEVWRTAYNEIERGLAPGGDLATIRDVASKCSENAARIAGVLHLLDGLDEGQAISGETMARANALAVWYLSEARRLLGLTQQSRAEKDAMVLESWMLERCNTTGDDRLKRRDVQQFGPNRTRDADNLADALGVLEGVGRVRAFGSEVLLNPALLDRGMP